MWGLQPGVVGNGHGVAGSCVGQAGEHLGTPPSPTALSGLRMRVVPQDLSASLQGGQKHLHAQTCPRREDPAQLVLVL